MKLKGARVVAIFAVFAVAPALAAQPAETAEPNVTPADAAPVQDEAKAAPAPASDAAAETGAPAEAAAQAAKPETAAADLKRADNDALLRAQAAGYKLVTKEGKEVFCKKEMVTGSRLATRTRCLTLAQIEAERNATKDMLLDMSRKTINIPQE